MTNYYRIQAYHSIICEYFCIGFIDFMLKPKSLLHHTNLFSHNEKNEKKFFSMMKIYCNVCDKYRKFKNLKISYIFKKH